MFTAFRRRFLTHLPASWRHQLVEIKNKIWGGWKHYYYSHFGEDAFIYSYFRNQKSGFYVDIGAHHPKRYSNTALLYGNGWCGINVEPDKNLIKLFDKMRRRDTNLCFAVGLKEGKAELHRYSDPAVNTLSQIETKRLKSRKWLDKVSVEMVPVRTLGSLLDEYMPRDTTIDFLNIDVEGLDLEVLQSNNWEKYQPRVLAVEDLSFNLLHPENSDLYIFLTKKGYVFLGYIGLTLIFLQKEELKTTDNDW